MNFLSSVPTLVATAPYRSKFGMPETASTIAPTIDVITWISIFFFVGIVAVMGYFMWKYRRVSHVADTGGPTHHTPLEVTWTVVPLILVIGIFYVGFRGYVYATTPPENAYEVEVVGQRWFWTFNYPNGAQTQVLYAPVDRPVRLRMQSEDVLHSVFIPAFRVKQDVVPGKRTELWFEATKTGQFDLFCTEYCGTQHSQMVTHAVIFEQDEFDARIQEEASWIDRVLDENLQLAGAHLYNRCSSCHTLDGTPLIGPSFKETYELYRDGGQRRLADGSSVTVDEDYIRSSIQVPLGQIAMNASTGDAYPSSMPAGLGTQLGDRRIEALVRFIMQLDQTTENGAPRMVDRSILMGEEGQ